MTNELSKERAIEALYTVRAYYASLTAGYPKGKDRRGIGDVMCSEIANSCLMAIKALERIPSYEAGYNDAKREIALSGEYERAYERGKADAQAKRDMSCEDCISRKAVLEWIKGSVELFANTYSIDTLNMWMLFDEQITAMPPVTPQPKVGEWLEKEVSSDKAIEEWQSARCSVCGRYHTTPYMYYFDNYKFCPSCGSYNGGD